MIGGGLALVAALALPAASRGPGRAPHPVDGLGRRCGEHALFRRWTRSTPGTSASWRWPGSGAPTTTVRTANRSCGPPRSTPRASSSAWPGAGAPWSRSTPPPARRSGCSASPRPSGGTTRCGRTTARASPTMWSMAGAGSTSCLPPSSCMPSMRRPVGRSPASAPTGRWTCSTTSAPGPTTVRTDYPPRWATSPTRRRRSWSTAWWWSATRTSRATTRPARRTCRATSWPTTGAAASTSGPST